MNGEKWARLAWKEFLGRPLAHLLQIGLWYEYFLRGGYVKIVAGDVLASYMRYETRCDICPVTLNFEKLA